MKFPLDVVIKRVNRTLHGRSVFRHVDVPGHNVFIGFNAWNGDGVDLFVPAGTPVYAAHCGRIVRIQDRGERNDLIQILGNGVESMYAHIHPKQGLALKSEIIQGQCIGYVGRELNDPHLHFELWVQNRAVSAPTAKKLLAKIKAILV